MTSGTEKSWFKALRIAAPRGLVGMLVALLAATGGCGGPDEYGVPELTKALQDPDADARFTAARLLGQHGRAAESAMPALGEALKDPDANVRMRAAYSMADIGPAAGAVAVLIEALKDQAREVRVAAAYALPAMGPEADSALAALKVAQNDADAKVRGEVANAIRRIELSRRYRTGGAKS